MRKQIWGLYVPPSVRGILLPSLLLFLLLLSQQANAIPKLMSGTLVWAKTHATSQASIKQKMGFQKSGNGSSLLYTNDDFGLNYAGITNENFGIGFNTGNVNFTPKQLISKSMASNWSVNFPQGNTTYSSYSCGCNSCNSGIYVDVDDETICKGESVKLTAVTNAVNPSYKWTPGGATTKSITVSPTSTTYYTVKVTQNNPYKVATTTAKVTVKPLPQKYTVTGGGSYCSGPGLPVCLSGSECGVKYILKKNGVTIKTLTGTGYQLCFGNQTAGTYCITAKNTGTYCTKEMGCVTITLGGLTTSGIVMDASCGGGNTGSIDLSVSGGTPPYTYMWSNGATTQDISNLAPGTYTVKVKDYKGCIGRDTFDVGQSGSLQTSGTVTNVSCNGDDTGAIDLTVSGGTQPYSYVWSNGATTQDIDNLSAGTYDVLVTDDNGCTGRDTFDVTEPQELIATTEASDTICKGTKSGSIDLTVTGGTTPYSYLWSNDSTTQDLNNLPAGIYSVVVTDANGCTATAEDTIVERASTIVIDSITVSPDTTVPCQQPHTIFIGIGPDTVRLTAYASGGTPPYTYSWSPDSSLSDPDSSSTLASPDTTTLYTVVVTDANGCSDTATVLITVKDYRCEGDKIQICHYPPGNPENPQDLCLPVPAILNAHLCQHGPPFDQLGPCPPAKRSPAGNEVIQASTEQQLLTGKLKIYPNPTTGMFVVELPAGVEAAHVSVMDLSGRVIEQKSTSDFHNKLQFDLNNVARGVYMIQIEADGQTSRSKINLR